VKMNMIYNKCCAVNAVYFAAFNYVSVPVLPGTTYVPRARFTILRYLVTLSARHFFAF
jgi:hypothetical protein